MYSKISNTKIYINNVDYTNKVRIKSTHFTLIPDKVWGDGEYEVRVQFKDISGLSYEPINWKFTIISERTLEKQKVIISQGGSLSGDYSSSYNDGNNLDVGELSGNYYLNLDWLRFRTNLLFSSLDNLEEQTLLFH